MDDTRIAWMKARVYTALGLKDDTLFENLVARDEGKMKEIAGSLNQPSKEYSPAIIFYPMHHDVEEMVEVVEGKWSYDYKFCLF